MNTSLRRGAGWALKVVLTLAVTYFLFRSIRVSWSEISGLEAMAWRPRLGPLVASLVTLLAVFAYLVKLWALMVKGLGGPSLRLVDAIRIFFLANLGRYLPGKFWQLAGLTYLAGRQGVSLPVASTSAVLGQVFSLGAAASLGVLGLLLAGFAPRYSQGLRVAAVALLVLISLLTTVPAALRFVLRLAFRLGRSGDEVPRLDPWFGARWLGLYMPAWVGYGIAFGLLWASFPALPRVSWLAATGGFASAYFFGYAALFAPAGLGVREGALAVMLAPWTGAAGATLLAVIARLWMTLAELVPLVFVGGKTLVGQRERLESSTDDK